MEKKLIKRIGIILLAVIVSMSMIPMVSEASDSDIKTVEGYMYSLLENHPEYGSEWTAISLARGGVDLSSQPFIDYYESLVDTVKEKEGVLSRSRYTEYSKVVLAVKALGRNPENVGGYNLLSKLSEVLNVEKQGINGPIWALIALDACGCEDAVKDEYIKYLLESPLKLEAGGWKLSASAASMDVDITSMAIIALAPYYSEREDVKEALDAAVDALKAATGTEGAYGENAGEKESAESTAQAVIAFCSLEIDCEDTVEALLSFRKGSGFSHDKGGTVNNMATDQGYRALVAYERFKDGRNGIYDFSDVEELKVAAPEKPVVTASALSNERISVKWKSVSGAKGYQICFGGKYYSTTSLSRVFSGLKPYTSYGAKIRAYRYVNGEKLYGPWSMEKSIKATYTAPAKPVISSLKSTSKKTLNAKWKKVSYVKGYQVAYRIKGGSYRYASTTYLSKTVKKLKSKKTYYVKVRAYKVVNGKKKYGKFSNVKTVKIK